MYRLGVRSVLTTRPSAGPSAEFKERRRRNTRRYSEPERRRNRRSGRCSAKRRHMRYRLLALAALATTVLAGAKPTVTPLASAETRAAASGKANVKLLARGDNAFVGRLELAPGAKVPEHRDATEEYIHVLEGKGVITIDGVQHEIGPGATVFMPANALVTYQNGDAKMVALQVFAGPAPAAKYDKWKAP